VHGRNKREGERKRSSKGATNDENADGVPSVPRSSDKSSEIRIGKNEELSLGRELDPGLVQKSKGLLGSRQ